MYQRERGLCVYLLTRAVCLPCGTACRVCVRFAHMERHNGALFLFTLFLVAKHSTKIDNR